MWAILGVVLAADALDLIDASVTNVAAPTIAADLGGGQALVKWLGAAYALALGSLLVLGGRLGDRFGQRRLFLVGIAGFTVASALCGAATDPAVLVAARAVQGAFGALLIPQGMAIMTKTFPPAMLRTAFGAFGPLLGISAVGGPVLAGFLVDADLLGLGWRPMFLVNLVLGGVGLVAAAALLPRDDGNRDVHIDALGSALLAGTMFSLLFGLVQGSTDGWTAAPVALLAVAATLFAGFARRQVTAARPLIEPALLRNRGFTSGLLMGLVLFAAISGLMLVLSLFLQTGLGYSPSRAALGLLPVTVGIIVGAGASHGLIARLGRTLVVLGLTVTLAGTAALLLVVNGAGQHPAWWQLGAPMLVAGAGMATCFGTVFEVALGGTDPEEAGAASGALSAVQQLAAGVGSASVTSVYFSVLAAHGQTRAVSASLLIVLGATAASLGMVRLLPRRAAVLEHH